MRRSATMFAALAAVTVQAAGAAAAGPTGLRLSGIGPLELGMTRGAALKTGWLAGRGNGCPLGGPPVPITYRLTGPNAPRGIEGSAEFDGGRLRVMSFTRGVRTGAGVIPGQTTAAQMVSRYRRAGLTAAMRYDPVFRGTFVTVTWRGRQVLGGFAPRHRLAQVAIPAVPVCE